MFLNRMAWHAFYHKINITGLLECSVTSEQDDPHYEYDSTSLNIISLYTTQFECCDLFIMCTPNIVSIDTHNVCIIVCK